MKIRLFISAIIGLLLISCIEIGSLRKKIDLSNIDLTKTLDIKPPNDGVAIVTSDLDTIAITAVAQTVVVNKFAPVKIEYRSAEEFPDYKNGGISRYNQTLAFEDTKKGDQDYNDLIVYVNQENGWDGKGYKIKLKVTPIALGSTIPIAFGFDDYDGDEYTIANDCRKELFKSDKGFINTVKNGNIKSYKTIHTKTYQMKSTDWKYTKLNFWIKASGNKLYIATASHSEEEIDYNSMIGTHNKPYGLSIPDFFEYPAETKSIYNTYPDFDKWIKGDLNDFRNTGYNLDNLYYQYYLISEIWHF
jgi:hypothetical protein